MDPEYFGTEEVTAEDRAYRGSRFSEVRDALFANPYQSTFATVRHRTVRSKGCLSNRTAIAMIFKLAQAAEKSSRRLDGHSQLPKLIPA
jgi:hypothetical protein